MWVVEEVDAHSATTRYLVKNTLTGGFLALNHQGGGALHFDDMSEAEAVAELLNECSVK